MTVARGVDQVSCGGVVFKKVDSEIHVCLIARRRNRKRIWCLPKGHVEAGEKYEETALREVREETGIHGTLIGSIQNIKYRFYDAESQKQISKTVHFFLIQFKRGNLEDHDDEVECAEWFPFQEALDRAVYKGERDVLKKAEVQIRNFK